MDELATALRALQARIARGEEFPDACATVAMQHGVNHDVLRTAYDQGDYDAALAPRDDLSGSTPQVR